MTIDFPLQTSTGTILYSMDHLLRWLHQDSGGNHARAGHETDILELMEQYGIVNATPIVAVLTPDQIAKQVERRVKMIESARVTWLIENIHPDAMIKVDESAEKGAEQVANEQANTYPKATAMKAWCIALGIEMYHRIALTMAGEWDESYLDFSAKKKPCEVEEIFIERGGF